MEEKQNNKILDFFIKTLNGMAYGLFATLIIGTIIGTIGTFFKNSDINFFKEIYNILGDGQTGVSWCLGILTGAGIGIGIALTLKANVLSTIVLASVGEIAAYLSLTTKFVTNNHQTLNAVKIGDPLTIYLVVVSVALLMKIIFKKKTPVDILIIPLFGVITGIIISVLLRYPTIYVTYGIQWLVGNATSAQPFIMGIVVSVLMGMALTAPISSAAIAAMIFTIPQSITFSQALSSPEYVGLALASGAAIVGCSTQMVGFAVQSRKDNQIGIVLSVGIGTSMLQFKNILKRPVIWLPTIITSAILGPISTCLLKLGCFGSAAGMGTAGLVGQIGTFSSMGNTWQTWVGIIVLEIIAPMVLVYIIDKVFRKLKWIKDGDLKI